MAPELGKPLFGAESIESSPAQSQNKNLSALQQPPLFHHHHSLIPSDSDALNSHATASLQPRITTNPYTPNTTAPGRSNLLIASPYTDPQHLLDLQTLDKPNQLLAQALSLLEPVRADYATAPYTEALNWDAVLEYLRYQARLEGYEWPESHFYVVAFRSRLRADADPLALHELDAHSHREATSSGGLLKYWFGTKDGEGRNLATCIWRSREDARLGGLGPWHKQARAAARDLYEEITFTTMRLDVGEGVRTWGISEWVEG